MRIKILQRLFFTAIFLLLMGVVNRTLAQDTLPKPVEPPLEVEEQLENLTESNDDVVIENDTYLQEMYSFLKNPINLNYADQGLLQQLQLLTPVQISNLLAYRKLLGNFLSIYELQAIPAWDIQTIKRIRPYITVDEKMDIVNSIGGRLKGGEHTLLIRAQQILEDQVGYDGDTSKSRYLGDPRRLFVRYKYKFGNLLQYGFTAEKDAGEEFFKGTQKQGFDFYSAHFFVRNLGIIKSLALGDFSVNMGQGLTQWQSLSFGKGGEILNTKRQSDVLRPYNSAAEIAFHRGVGITLKKDNWETTAFVSMRRLDANFNVDTLNFEDFVSSLQTSGLHRTKTEVANKNTQGQFTVGGNISYSNERFHLGANAIHYSFDHPIIKDSYLYNKYALNGKTAGNYSVDYSYTYKNAHIFGELAVDEKMNKALISGMVISTNSAVDMTFLYRNISPQYQSLYTSAFTENTYPTNESGFYTGITIYPNDKLKLSAYADFFHFPWVKYRTDAPTYGSDYMVQMTYTPSRGAEFYVRYKNKSKSYNYNPYDAILNPVVAQPLEGLRLQFKYKITSSFTLRSRVDLAWYDKGGDAPENGFLTYVDFIYKPVMKPFSGNIRLAYFETDGYNSRMYAYENDVLYGYSIPVLYGKGYRYYINVNYDLTKRLSLWARFAQFIYPGKETIGSGLDLIKGNTKSELKVQAIYTF